MMNAMKQKFRSPDQAKLKIICDELCDNIDNLLESLSLEYNKNSKMIFMKCPIHGGDNASALNIYPEGESYRGNWKCRTHNCENIFKSSIIGFVRGVISNQKYNWSKEGDKTASFDEAVNYALSFLKKDLKQIKISKIDRDKNNFTNFISNLQNKKEEIKSKITRKEIIKSIDIPAKYYLERNYSEEILKKYDIGLCTNPDRPMHNRVVVPIYDNEYKYMIACTGRSIFEKCSECKSHHHLLDDCPSDDKLWLHSKWRHSKDFKSQNCLYNFWFAKKFILQTQTAIIVESPGNVWRLEENDIHNSIAIFGSSLSDRQKILLDSSGAMNLIILTDVDEAGKKAAEQIRNKCKNTYRIFVPKISKNDVGEMTKEEIDLEIKEYIERIK
jgi:5S rRNA maturation endonuclease (ribonuclease M5)